MKKLTSILLLSAMLMMLCITQAIAKSPEVIELSPSPDSFVKLQSVQLVKYSDKEVTFRVKGHKEPNSEPLSFAIEVDPENKTYKTIKKERPSPELFTEEPDDTITPQALTITYVETVFIDTLDPVDIECCETYLTLKWTVDQNYDQIVSATRTKGQYDWQPTAAGTNWYLSYNNYGSFTTTSTYSTTSTHAKHYNYDFQDDSLATYAYHDIGITGYKDGSFDYSADWNHTGEYYYLLKGSVYIP